MIRRSRRRRGTYLTDDDDLLREILLRLPPRPSSLPRASAVCKRWRGLVTDPKFLRRFYAHHRKPPLIGVFNDRYPDRVAFRAILGRPNRIPPQRFDLRRHGVETDSGSRTRLLGCRHARVLLMDHVHTELVVCAPVTGEQRRVPVPPDLVRGFLNGAVLCAAGDLGHVHGDCHSSPFKVVSVSRKDNRPTARVYSSETATWGNLITTTDRCELVAANPGILVGDALYWSPRSVGPGGLTDDIIKFDLGRQILAVIKGPPGFNESCSHQIIHTEDGVVGLAILSRSGLEIWQRKVSCHGAATWLLQKTVEMHIILGIAPQNEGSRGAMELLGYDEDNGVLFLYAAAYVYMVQLMSMQSNELHLSNSTNKCHPFTCFYAPAIPGGRNGPEMLQDT
ncbi:uncharacterized protein LOC119280750 [Triticum dicoccoides]|uniref:uncharacterized protein LOC119280750 n=1 Tax=Triticum dicoccoides TaxID=85692 RepID=UPI00188DF65D|nr:uncharacterized protein LOC119280750 [Triticum dicoccoides]